MYVIGNFFGKHWSEQSFVFGFVNIFLGCIDISMVGHICHSLTQTENNVKVEELFEDDANYPEPEDVTYDKLNDFNEERKGTGTSQYQKLSLIHISEPTRPY